MKNVPNHSNCNHILLVSPFFYAVSFVLLFSSINAAPIADGAGKFLGNIIQSNVPGNFGDYWNQITIENNGKWANVEGQRGRMNWGSVSAAYSYCESHDIPYKHHTFVWGQQYPSWMNSISRQDQKAEVEELIREFGKKFPNTAFIDVVNEAFDKSPGWKEALGGAGETGYDWIIWSFETARKYCPNSKLLINEYYCEYDMERVKEYRKLVNILKERDLIDGVGLQTHDGETKKGFDMGILKECIDTLAITEIPIYSSEFDMSGNDDEQLKYFQNIFPILWEHPAIHGVTLWGWTDSWLLSLSNPKDGRLIINGRERPAMKWLREYVSEHKDVTPVCYYKGMSIAGSPTLSFSISSNSFMHLQVHSAQKLSCNIFTPNGKTVASFSNRFFPAGAHRVSLPYKAIVGGCYIVKILGNNMNQSQTFVNFP